MSDEKQSLTLEDSEDKIRAMVHAGHMDKMSEEFWKIMYGEESILSTTELSNREIHRYKKIIILARRYNLKQIEAMIYIEMEMKRSRSRLGRKEALRGITGESEVKARAGIRNRLLG